jgi:hypothetical protein
LLIASRPSTAGERWAEISGRGKRDRSLYEETEYEHRVGSPSLSGPLAEHFVEELVAHSKRDPAAKPAFARRLPLLPRPKEPKSIH